MMDLGPKPGTELEPITIGSTTYMLELRQDSSPVVWTMQGATLLPTDPETSAHVLTHVMERCIALGVPDHQTLSQFLGVPRYVVPDVEPVVVVELNDLGLSRKQRERADALRAVMREGVATGWATETAEGFHSTKTQKEIAANLVADYPAVFPKHGDHVAMLYRLLRCLPAGMFTWDRG